MKDLYSPQEVAQILGVHVKTIRRYLREGTIMGKKIGGSWKISSEEIQKHLDKTIPDQFNRIDKYLSTGKGKIRRCLMVEVDVSSQAEANGYAQALMEVINSNAYQGCKFKYHLEGRTAKFILNGPNEYLQKMLMVIEEVESR